MENVLILGGKGLLGGYLRQAFPQAVSVDREDVDVSNPHDLKVKIEGLKNKPQILINCVAYNDVDGAEKNKDLAILLNRDVVKILVELSNDIDATLIHFSSNFVFDGQAGEYDENSLPSPESVYADSKYQGEQILIDNAEKYYLIRTAVLFGLKGESSASKKTFVDLMLDLSAKTDTIKAVNDEVYSVTYAHDLAEQVRWLLEAKPKFGTYHFVNSGQASWYELAKEIFKDSGKKVSLTSVSGSEFPRAAKRPAKSVLLNTKSLQMRSWQEALKEYLDVINSKSNA